MPRGQRFTNGNANIGVNNLPEIGALRGARNASRVSDELVATGCARRQRRRVAMADAPGAPTFGGLFRNETACLVLRALDKKWNREKSATWLRDSLRLWRVE